MSMVLLDTDVVSYLAKEDTRRLAYAQHLLGHELSIAIMTVAELFQWATVRQWSNRRIAHMEIWLQRYTLLPVDIETCRFWATVRAHRAARGFPISPQDAWIAATALRYDVPLVTHNVRDY